MMRGCASRMWRICVGGMYSSPKRVPVWRTPSAPRRTRKAITPYTLEILEQLRRDSGAQADDELVVGLSMSQISKYVDLAFSMARRHAPLQAVQTHGRWKSPQNRHGVLEERMRLRHVNGLSNVM